MSKDYRSLVIGGAGTNIYAYLGAMEVLFNDSDFYPGGAFYKIKNFIGSSAGALLGAILAAGADLKYFRKKMNEINVSMMADHSAFFPINIYRLCTSFGYNKGDALLKAIEDVLEELTGNKDITLQGLYEFKGRKVNFIATGCNMSRRQVRYFNRLSDPDMKVSHAVRISVSIPLYFKAFEYQKDLYIDGGIISSIPIEFVETSMFKLLNEYDPDIIGVNVPDSQRVKIGDADDDLYNLPKDNDEMTNGFIYIMNRTIGLKTFSGRSLKYYNPRDQNGHNESENFTLTTYLDELLNLILDSVQKFHIDERHWIRICKINVDTISSVNFNLTDADKAVLLECGIKGALAFLNSKNQITPVINSNSDPVTVLPTIKPQGFDNPNKLPSDQ